MVLAASAEPTEFLKRNKIFNGLVGQNCIGPGSSWFQDFGPENHAVALRPRI